jgi:hypothetical protein
MKLRIAAGVVWALFVGGAANANTVSLQPILPGAEDFSVSVSTTQSTTGTWASGITWETGSCALPCSETWTDTFTVTVLDSSLNVLGTYNGGIDSSPGGGSVIVGSGFDINQNAAFIEFSNFLSFPNNLTLGTDPTIYLESQVAIFGTPEMVPLPAALSLFATGLGALGLLGWRRKRSERSVWGTRS